MRGVRSGTASSRRGFRRRWWNTLAFRLGITVNSAVVLVLAVSALIDHRRDAEAQIQHAVNRLQEEAQVLRAAWSQFRDAAGFQRFVDGFCRQMTTSASPGHHIAVFGQDGGVLVRAHERADSELERRMSASTADGMRTFELAGEQYAAYSLDLNDGANLVVSVSLQPVEEMLRTQGASRVAATATLVLVLFGVTVVCLVVWVRNPLRALVRVVAAVGERRFDQWIAAQGVAELRFLADGVNEMARALARSERQRVSEMERAQAIQRALVGSGRHRTRGCEIDSLFIPAETVGGDFVDVVTLNDGSTLVVVIDVTGHGVPGALCTALLRSSLRHLAQSTTDVGRIACGLNQDLCDVAAAGVFATAALLRIGLVNGEVEYVNAGHDPPLLIDAEGNVCELNHAGLMLGVEREVGYETGRVCVAPRSKLFVYTDGLHEATSPQDEQYGRTRTLELFVGTAHLPLKEQLAAAVSQVRAFRGSNEFDDDVTVVGIAWDGVAENSGSDRLTAQSRS